MCDPGGKQSDVEALTRRRRRAPGYGGGGAIELAAGELDPSTQQRCSGSRREVIRTSGRAVQVADLDLDAAFQRVTETEERTCRVGVQEGKGPLDARQCLAAPAIGEPNSRERELADEREGRTHVFAHRE